MRAGKTQPYILATDLGAPDTQVFEDRLTQFLLTGDHIQFLYNIELEPEGRCLRFKPHVEAVVKRIRDGFGSHADSMLGISQTFRNYEMITHHPDASWFRCTARCAVWVGAGPSLDNFTWNILREIYEKRTCLIVVCDAVLKKAIAEGVKPDVVTTSERVDEVQAFFEGLTQEDLSETTLISTVMGSTKVSQEWQGKAQGFLWRKDFPSHFYPRRERALTGSWPSVSPTSLGLLGMWGIKEICLVGQDLAYHEDRSHTDLANPEQEKMMQEEELKREKIKVPGNVLPSVLTHPTWVLMREDIRRVMGMYNLSLVNSSHLGQKIVQIPFVYLKDWWGSWEKIAKPFTLEAEIKTEELRWEAQAFKRECQKAERALLDLEDKIGEITPQDFIQSYPITSLGKSSLQHAYYTYLNRVFRHGEEKMSFLVDFRSEALRALRDILEIIETKIEKKSSVKEVRPYEEVLSLQES